MKFAFSHYSTW